MITITDYGVAFPGKKITSEEIANWTGGAEDFIKNKVGIQTRHFLAEGETGVDLSARAVTKIFAKRPSISISDIDLLVYVTQNPDHLIPQNASILAAKLGARKNLASFDLSLGCSGWVYGLNVVRGLMAQEDFYKALLVTCDPYSRIMNKEDKATVTVFGDGAAATLIESSPIDSLGKGDFGTDGSLAGHLILDNSSNNNEAPLKERVDGSMSTSPSLHMDGRGILEFMMKNVPSTVEACLQKNKLQVDDIDLFVFHQASLFMVRQLIRCMKLPPEKVPVDVKNTGNTVSASIPIMMETLQKEGRLKDKKVLVCGFGVGLSWATNIIQF